MRVRLADDALPSSGQLGDWYANVLNVGHARYVLCLSEPTLLPVILPARQSEFPARFNTYLAEVLRMIGAPPEAIALETSHSTDQSVFAKTKNRSLLGSLKDNIFCAEVYLAHGDSYIEANRKLVDMPSGVLDYVYPSEAARAALSTRPKT